ncbi:hypothetical protein F4679DRAFT_404669 [Xylaria curta]|nr:hypothetical protein F4679DRAFT_404669 [Xylaria curta]
MAATEQPAAVLVPMTLQALVVSEDYPTSSYRIAPLIQPNYAALRSGSGLIQHDVMEQLEMSHTRLKAQWNTRFVDVTSGEVYKDRVGVYLSWCLPRAYRSAITATETAAASQAQAQLKRGYITSKEEVKDSSATGMTLRAAPNRWLIFRLIDDPNIENEVYVLESDRIRNINDGDLADLGIPDVENLTSSFIDPSPSLEEQHEVFLGFKSSLGDYKAKDPNAKYRSPFTIVESANELFADFQPHNTSIFSVFDSLGGIADAKVTYFVAGFHANVSDDPLSISPEELERPTYGALLKSCYMTVDPRRPSRGMPIPDFLDAKANVSTRIICHGALRDVVFSRASCKLESPANKLQELINKCHPIAIGTNTLDALLAYVRVQYEDRPQSADGNDVLSQVDDMLSKLIMLIARPDNIDAQQKADDEIGTADWKTETAEPWWTLADSMATNAGPDISKRPTEPPPDVKIKLQDLNETQSALSSCQREMSSIQHALYAHWWNVLEAHQSHRQATLEELSKAAIVKLLNRFQQLETIVTVYQDTLETTKAAIVSKCALEATTALPFGVHQDPTVLFAGVSSGWPKGFSDPVSVRLSTHIPAEPPVDKIGQKMRCADWQSLIDQAFPETWKIVASLAVEAIQKPSGDWPPSPYADQELFVSQGWFPLFMEWEVEYYHLPWGLWRFVNNKDGDWVWQIRREEALQALKVGGDCRNLNGRTMIVPQASSSLKLRLKQLFTRLSRGQLNSHINEDDRSSVLDKVSAMEFFSSPLSGIRDHLTTLMRGVHASPHGTGDITTKTLGIDPKHFPGMHTSSHLAPYGHLCRIPAEYTGFCPFKPVTHGQFRFTRLNIVDKFGQIVSAIEPEHIDGSPPTALYPCLSPSVTCDPIPGTFFPNTAIKADTIEGVCQFFQIGPRINQSARLNATFVTKKGALYCPVSEWQDLIWGWILANNTDHSIQIFDGDGTFIQEVRVEPGSSATFVSTHPNRKPVLPSSTKLGRFISRFSSSEYVKGLFSMLMEAIDAVGSSTLDHSDLTSAVFGKPFCLTDVGCSLELAEPPLSNQSLQLTLPPEKPLLDYRFPAAFGNPDASYDGFVGYFTPDSDVSTIYTAFGDPKPAGAPTTNDNPVNHEAKPLELAPYFLAGDTAHYTQEQSKHLQVVSMISDPFRPIHIYTGGLVPMKSLTLPKWAMDKALNKMHAFFRNGPVLVPTLPPSDIFQIQSINMQPGNALKSVQMPLAGVGDWKWLQPRLPVNNQGEITQEQPVYDELSVGDIDAHLNLDTTLTSEIIEGYLIMTKSVMQNSA